MRDSAGRPSRSFAQLCLVIVIAALVFFIAVGTIWAFATGRARPGANKAVPARSLMAGGKANPAPGEVASSDVTGKTTIFSAIGTLRAATADKKPVTIIIKPFIPYPSDDIAFGEELASKTRSIRASVTGWFRSRTLKDIRKLGELGVKKCLLDEINGNLVLGKGSSIYFEEYMVLE